MSISSEDILPDEALPIETIDHSQIHDGDALINDQVLMHGIDDTLLDTNDDAIVSVNKLVASFFT